MRQVALISQTLRASHCHAYMNNTGQQGTILTSHPSAFADLEFARPTQVIAVSPPPELLPSTRLAGTRIFRAALNRARSGSRLGAWLERTIKRFAWRLRYLDRFVLLRRRHRAADLDERTVASSAMYLRLQEEHETTAIDRIVVFDVFDLAVALAFAERHGVDLLVR